MPRTSTSPSVPIDRHEPAIASFRRVLANLADTIDAHRAGAVDGRDPEHLHDLRVAVRRTRSVLTEGKGVLPKGVRRRYREGFGWLGERTGTARDLDVYVLEWDDYVAPLDQVDRASLHRVRGEVEARRVAARVELATVLEGEDYRVLLDSWRAWLTDPSVRTSSGPPTGAVVADRVERAQAKLLDDGRSITHASEPERLHDLRKDAKKLRYLLECFAALFPSSDRKAFVTELKDLQVNLGAHQDAEVHLAHLRDLAQDLQDRSVVDTDALLAMGQLRDQLERRRLAERADFAARFARYDRKANRKALERMLRRARHR